MGLNESFNKRENEGYIPPFDKFRSLLLVEKPEIREFWFTPKRVIAEIGGGLVGFEIKGYGEKDYYALAIQQMRRVVGDWQNRGRMGEKPKVMFNPLLPHDISNYHGPLPQFDSFEDWIYSRGLAISCTEYEKNVVVIIGNHNSDIALVSTGAVRGRKGKIGDLLEMDLKK